ncbi:Hypothetical predicted protein [Octopus vulgaris]|uniref:Uncharacterized protein n=1 Tax=Octopus vulgaris TaxID=6645 RepID=A0AA36EZY7_OCTVU|nr:Hypothetical predicted protein [Octopus vulgaris]
MRNKRIHTVSPQCPIKLSGIEEKVSGYPSMFHYDSEKTGGIQTTKITFGQALGVKYHNELLAIEFHYEEIAELLMSHEILKSSHQLQGDSTVENESLAALPYS